MSHKRVGVSLVNWMDTSPVGSTINLDGEGTIWKKTAEGDWISDCGRAVFPSDAWLHSTSYYICSPNYTVEEECDDC